MSRLPSRGDLALGLLIDTIAAVRLVANGPAMKLYKYMTPLGVKRFLETGVLRFTAPSYFNDPFELRAYLVDAGSANSNSTHDDHLLNDDLAGVAAHILKQISDRIGICCFSLNQESILMWSIYAEGHSGAVVSFDGDHDFFRSALLKQVQYSNKRPVVDLKELRETGFHLGGWEDLREFIEIRSDVFLTKAECWSHEQEVRAVRELATPSGPTGPVSSGLRNRPRITGLDGYINENQLIKVPPAAVLSVVLGAKHQLTHSVEMMDVDCGFEHEIRFRLQANPEYGHVRLYRAHADFETFAVRIYDPTDRASAARYLHPIERRAYDFGEKGPLSKEKMEWLKPRIEFSRRRILR